MYRLTLGCAALIAAGWIAAGPSSNALIRADDDWNKGDYVAALTAYQQMLTGPDAASLVEPIALQTGELFRTTELTTDGANPVFAPDTVTFPSKRARLCRPVP